MTARRSTLLPAVVVLLGGRAALADIFDAESGGTKITLGMDINYPPYAYQTEDGLAGFGVDFANGLTALCDDLSVEMAFVPWPDCWSDDDGGTLGLAILDGTVDGCVSYIHTHIRDSRAEFSDAMLDDNKAAGLLTLLDENGNPTVGGMDDLSGRTLIDVAGWAPSAEGLGFVTNQCTGEGYADDMEILSADVDERSDNPNDTAMRMLRNGLGDAIFIMADQAASYKSCPPDATWDCSLWKGFGEEYAYVQSGQFGYVKNGTTFSISKKGAGIRDLLRPCMSKFMASKEYYSICSKHNIIDKCYKNDFFDEDARSVPVYDKPTHEQFGGCSDGYCPCSAHPTVEAAPAAESENTDDSGGFPAWTIAVIVVGAILAAAAVYGGRKVYLKRRKARIEERRVERQTEDLKRKVLSHAAVPAVPIESVTVVSGSSGKVSGLPAAA